MTLACIDFPCSIYDWLNIFFIMGIIFIIFMIINEYLISKEKGRRW